MVKDGEFEFVIDVFKWFLVCIDEWVKMIDELLVGSFDFILDEDLMMDFEVIDYLVDELEVCDCWCKWIKYNLFVLKSEEIDN